MLPAIQMDFHTLCAIMDLYIAQVTPTVADDWLVGVETLTLGRRSSSVLSTIIRWSLTLLTDYCYILSGGFWLLLSLWARDADRGWGGVTGGEPSLDLIDMLLTTQVEGHILGVHLHTTHDALHIDDVLTARGRREDLLHGHLGLLLLLFPRGRGLTRGGSRLAGRPALLLSLLHFLCLEATSLYQLDSLLDPLGEKSSGLISSGLPGGLDEEGTVAILLSLWAGTAVTADGAIVAYLLLNGNQTSALDADDVPRNIRRAVHQAGELAQPVVARSQHTSTTIVITLSSVAAVSSGCGRAHGGLEADRIVQDGLGVLLAGDVHLLLGIGDDHVAHEAAAVLDDVDAVAVNLGHCD